MDNTMNKRKEFAAGELALAAQRYSACMDEASRKGFTLAYKAAGRAGISLADADTIVRNATVYR